MNVVHMLDKKILTIKPRMLGNTNRLSICWRQVSPCLNDSSEVKRACYSCSGAEFCFQYPHWELIATLHSVQGDLAASSGLYGHLHKHAHTNTHIKTETDFNKRFI